MFTGLIRKTGTFVKLKKKADHYELWVAMPPWDRPAQIGESIAVEGVCLSLVSQEKSTVQFDLLLETLDKTNLDSHRPGDVLNVERALQYGDPIDGHFVHGHVDGVGEVRSLHQGEQEDTILQIACKKELMNLFIPKGSVACNGVSLTLVDVAVDFFTVHLIPLTLRTTSLRNLKESDKVNLEIDMLAKYAQHCMKTCAPLNVLSWEELDAQGWIT